MLARKCENRPLAYFWLLFLMVVPQTTDKDEIKINY
ncbi:Uncharacterised protein [Mycobacteroides abscessus subsp. abscessus]|nr:Uncharacterised protein [Mycobacteroides abscessus subsp. abscessus]